jgi:hypothetical protein
VGGRILYQLSVPSSPSIAYKSLKDLGPLNCTALDLRAYFYYSGLAGPDSLEYCNTMS